MWHYRSLLRLSREIYIIKSDVCLSVCGHSDVRLTTPPVLMLWGTQGYLWLPYDPMEVIKLIRERIEPIFFSKKYSMSFLLHYCHSFRTTVSPSGFLTFSLDFCHSFQMLSFLQNYCHSFRMLSFLPNYCHFKYLSS